MFEQQQRRMREGLSRKMKELAKLRQCPQCKRKMALSKRIDGDYRETWCRYCGWAKGGYIGG